MTDKKHQRNIPLQIYLTPREAQEIEAAIKRAKQPGAKWLRDALLDAARQGFSPEFWSRVRE